jgi:hypothetical protein
MTHEVRAGLDDRELGAPAEQRVGHALHVQVHPDALDLRVVLERVGRHLAAEAAGLVAAERRGGVVDVVGVDPDRPGLELRAT